MKALSASKRYYCSECGLLLLKEALSSHEGHDVMCNVTNSQLDNPTNLLCPVDERKSQAVKFTYFLVYNHNLFIVTIKQFLFSDKSLHFLQNELKRLHYTHVLCVGTPRYGVWL